MNKYLGEEKVSIEDSIFTDYGTKDWILYFIEMYGGIDGAHHKDWLIDQIVRILHGAKMNIKLAKWDDGTEEYRVSIGMTTIDYELWVQEYEKGEDGPSTYSYDEGIAP